MIRSHMIITNWLGTATCIDLTDDRHGRILFFMTCSVDVQRVNIALLFARVQWPKRLMIPDLFVNKFLKVFAKNVYEKDGHAIYMTVH